MEDPNQAATATMGAARGVPEELARGDLEAGALGALAALEERARGVLGQMRATTHDVPLDDARLTRCKR